MFTLQTLYFVLSAVLILVGLAGTVLPALPGVPLMYAGMFLAAWADRFVHVGTITLAVLGVLCLLALATDVVAGLFGARRVGAGPRAIWGATIGTVVGLFFGLAGIVFGPFLGAVAGELLDGSRLARATHVGIATWLGLLFGTLAKLALSFTMLGVFALSFLL